MPVETNTPMTMERSKKNDPDKIPIQAWAVPLTSGFSFTLLSPMTPRMIAGKHSSGGQMMQNTPT
jgi:hypothetical protein